MATKVEMVSADDPYDISTDADIIKEESRAMRLRKRHQQQKKMQAAEKACPAAFIKSEGDALSTSDQVVVTAEGNFLCATCPRAFKSITGRQRHMNKCNGEVPSDGNCPCCGLKADAAHKEGDHTCTDCSGKFMDETALEHHIEVIHRRTETFGCALCPQRYDDKELLTNHLQTHSDTNPWLCKKCNAVFTRKYHLDRHLRQSGCNGVPRTTISCQVCGRGFTRKDNLREHLRAHAGMNKRLTVYTCEYCGIEVAGIHNFNIHKRDKHVGNRPYKCSFCEMYFPTSGAMKKHQRKHTGEKPYECRECFRKFAAKETLNRHMKIHTLVRPFGCPHCGKGFIQNTQLRAHLFQHTGENGFKCEQCDMSFSRKIRLDTHIKFDHEKQEPFSCEHCVRTFFVKVDLEKHMLTHTGEKAFKCDKCGKAFALKAYLKTHSLTHTKEPPRACNYCNRAFIRQDCLLRHMRARHRDKLERILIEAERKKLQLQLLTITAKETALPPSAPAEDLAAALPGSISDLLSIIVDEDTLQTFGAPTAPVDDVLKMVIKRCGHTPVEDPNIPMLDRLRENAKLLFTVVIDDAGVKALLNNQSVDEVIQHVLNLVKS